MTARSTRPTVFAKAPPLVLVVDDDAGMRRLIERMLRTLGCDVVLAQDGASARDALSAPNAVVRLAIVDLTLPDVDGYALIEELHERLGSRGPRFIVLSGRGDPRGIPEGAVAMLRKPVPMFSLLATVKDAIGAPTGQSQVLPKSTSRPPRQ